MIRGDQQVAITHGLSNINNKCYIERYDFIFHYNLFSPSHNTVNIPHTLLVFTYAHPKWQNSQSDDGGHSTEEVHLIGSFISLWKLINTDLLILNKSEMPVCLYELIHGDDQLWVTDDVSK